MDHAAEATPPITPEWCAEHFDHLSPRMGQELYPTLEFMREHLPVVHSDAYEGFWMATTYAEVLRIAQDWSTFSSQANGISIPTTQMLVPALPVMLDLPVHRVFRKIINPYLTPAVVAGYEPVTRELVTRMIDGFIEAGRCDFQADFATPFPGLMFFEHVLHAPPQDAALLNELSTAAVNPSKPDARRYWQQMFQWILDFIERRKVERQDDVVDAVIHAEIDGRPITRDETVGTIQLLILGGLDTTAGALGQIMIRLCRRPEVGERMRAEPARFDDCVEELLRLDGPFAFVARTAMADTEIGGCPVHAGERVLVSWASANRDEREFPHADEFDPDRESNRHIAFGAGPHRCVGSNVARLNLRVALREIVHRMPDVRLADPAAEIPFHSAYNRTPLSLPVEFTPGPRLGSTP